MTGSVAATRRVFGIPILDLSMGDALALCVHAMQAGSRGGACVYFVNAHTLNLAYLDPAFRRALCAADWVFGDGTGVRWAVRFLHGQRLRDNVNGTGGRDLGCAITARRVGRCDRARCGTRARRFGWQLVGHHHGYVSRGE
jgi:UDP-N-acetyl-D-mannosaminuronic acid transferase (WecB/TagA/CpsF family)